MSKKVLITGASRGIGHATGKRLVELGYEVIGTSRKGGGELDGMRMIALELTDDSSIRQCSESVGAVDILINNAGISQIGAAEEIDINKVRELFQVNLFGIMNLTQNLLPDMRKKGNGHIINMGSLAGKFAVPFQSIYVSSKFALAGYTWSLRNEVKPFGIKVSCIEPNDVETTISPEMCLRENSPYEPMVDQVLSVRKKGMKTAPSVDCVVDQVVKILKDDNPAPFYAVGHNANLMTSLKRFVPDRLMEQLVLRSYGLHRF